MTTLTCTRRIEFDTAHRVMGHGGKCKYLHGHRYVLEVCVAAEGLDDLGMVIDFGEIKDRVEGWINSNWDHSIVLWTKDKTLGEAIAAETKQNVFYLPDNPTAENMALYFVKQVFPTLFNEPGIRCHKVRLYETPNCFVEVVG
ncbi:MAG: 6-carboxy-5,6,7,8-tetrahydropterin synthase [Rickettsiales bacterium]|jgi:6-pyruvoyltetrahydropterin/6-carboxytetrahydropterin synthase|nr:6-carboxy-5,6,7,8-tetrahydropterin synthase [Rickettsiales bacterium]